MRNTEAERIPTAVEDNFEIADEISELQVNLSTTPDHAALDIIRPETIGDQLPLITDILGDPGSKSKSGSTTEGLSVPCEAPNKTIIDGERPLVTMKSRSDEDPSLDKKQFDLPTVFTSDTMHKEPTKAKVKFDNNSRYRSASFEGLVEQAKDSEKYCMYTLLSWPFPIANSLLRW